MFASFLAFKLLIVCGAEGDSSRHRFTITSNDAWLSVVLKFLKFVSLRSHGLHTKRGKTSLRGSAFPYRYSAVARSCGFPLLQRFCQWEISPTDLQSRQQLKLTDLLAVYNFLGHDPRNTRKSRLCFEIHIFPFPGTQSMGKLILNHPFHQSLIWNLPDSRRRVTSPSQGSFSPALERHWERGW